MTRQPTKAEVATYRRRVWARVAEVLADVDQVVGALELPTDDEVLAAAAREAVREVSWAAHTKAVGNRRPPGLPQTDAPMSPVHATLNS